MTRDRDARVQPQNGPGNQIAPARAKAGEAKSRSVLKGDMPQSVLDRYLVERDLRGLPERFYRDHRTPHPAFRDAGRHLSSERTYPDTVADMLKVAEHRGWSRLKVTGEAAFRREVWVQARERGIAVQGYRPHSRDYQAAGVSGPASLRERLNRAAIVVRALIPDQATQDRLIARAAVLAGLKQDQAQARSLRDRDRDRQTW